MTSEQPTPIRPRVRKRPAPPAAGRPSVSGDQVPKTNGLHREPDVPIQAPAGGLLHDEPPSITDRLAPWSLEAEQSVLGSILIDQAALERVIGILQPAH